MPDEISFTFYRQELRKWHRVKELSAFEIKAFRES